MFDKNIQITNYRSNGTGEFYPFVRSTVKHLQLNDEPVSMTGKPD